MNLRLIRTRLWGSITIFLLVSACSLPFLTGDKPLNQETPTEGQQADTGNIANQQEVTGDKQVEGILPDPQAGLAGLPAYLAGFRQDVTGTLEGQPYERHTYLLLSRSTASGDYDFMNLFSGTGLPDYQSRLLAFDHAFYRWTQPDQSCQGSDQAPAEGEVMEPASFLLPVMQAVRVGSEMINGIDCTHYQFSEKDLNGVEDGAQVVGDVWIADEDGFVVRYSLLLTPPADSPADDFTVTQSWTYDLSILEASAAILLPPNCNPVPIDLPLPVDAQDIRRSGGQINFETVSSARQVLDFYLSALPDSGWSAPSALPEGEIELPFMASFTQAEQTLDLVMDEADSNGTRVDIYIGTSQMPAQAGNSLPTTTNVPSSAGVTPTPVSTIDPASSGLPEDIPLYPGATDLFSMDTVTMFASTDSLDTVRDYYRDNMPLNGWVLSMEQNASGTEIQEWSKNGVEVFITLSADGGKVSIVITRVSE